MAVRALLLSGSVGTGKSTTADRVEDRLRAADVPHAVIDLDQIRRAWPTPNGDGFGFERELRNLAPLVHNYLAAGARRLVLAGVCETLRDRARYEAILGVPLVVCRLRGRSAHCTRGFAGATSTSNQDWTGIWLGPVSSTAFSTAATWRMWRLSWTDSPGTTLLRRCSTRSAGPIESAVARQALCALWVRTESGVTSASAS